MRARQASLLMKNMQLALAKLSTDWHRLFRTHGRLESGGRDDTPSTYFCDATGGPLRTECLVPLVVETLRPSEQGSQGLHEDPTGDHQRFVISRRFQQKIGERQGRACFTLLLSAGEDPRSQGQLSLFDARPATDEDVKRLISLR